MKAKKLHASNHRTSPDFASSLEFVSWASVRTIACIGSVFSDLSYFKSFAVQLAS